MSVYSLDDVVGEIPSEIKEQLLNLHRLDTEIAHLEVKLNEARKQRDAVYYQLERFCERRAPIRRMPYEILATVFYNYPELQLKRNSTLMRVCKLWRRILMDTPGLWNHISLDLRKIEDLPLLWNYARSCLIYSGSLPLYIHLDARNLHARHSLLDASLYFHIEGQLGYAYDHDSYAEIILRPFLNYSVIDQDVMRAYECVLLMTMAALRGDDDRFIRRWRRFHCDMGGSHTMGSPWMGGYTVGALLWDSVNGDTESLVDLEIISSYSGNEYWDPTGFPNLKSLKGFSTSLDVSLGTVGLPVGTLERLIVLDDLPSMSFLDFPSGVFTSLQLLQLELFFNLVHSDSKQTIHLPALKVLAISGEDYSGIIRRFNAPRLTHLGFSQIPPADDEVPSLFNTVTDVMLSLWKADEPADLRLLLSSMPSLRCLHVRRRDATQVVTPVLEGETNEGGPAVHCTENPAHWPYIIPTWDA